MRRERRGAEHLRGLFSLEELNLRDNALTGAGLVHLRDSRRLKTLSLGTNLNDAGMRCLAPLTKLEELSIAGSPDLTDEGLASLTPMTAMRTLEIINTSISDQGLANLKEMRDLETLSLRDNQRIEGTGLVHLERMEKLRVLNLRGCKLSEDGLVHVGQIASLKLLYLDENPITGAGLAHLWPLRGLGTLSLSDMDIEAEHIDALSRLTLGVLRLTHCRIHCVGFKSLTQLKGLDLTNATLSNSIFAELQQLPLQLLVLTNTNVTVVALAKLARCKTWRYFL